MTVALEELVPRLRSDRTRRMQLTRRRGFSLIEMLIVIVIAGVAMAMAVSRVDITRYKADAAVQLVRSTLQKAQRDAITQQHDVIISFDTVTQQMRVVWDANNDGQISTGERVLYYSLDLGNKFSVPTTGINGAVTQAIVGASIRTLTALPTVTFHRDGSLSTNLEIYVATASRRSTPNYRAITVIQATGRSDWYRYNTEAGKWVGAAL